MLWIATIASSLGQVLEFDLAIFRLSRRKQFALGIELGVATFHRHLKVIITIINFIS